MTIPGFAAASRYLSPDGHFRYRIWSLTVILIGITLSAIAFRAVHDNEKNATRHAFEEKVQINVTAIRLAIERGMESLESAGTLFDSADVITRSQFHVFGQRALSRNPALKAVVWAPRVPSSGRKAFEIETQRQLPGFEIIESNARFEPVPAGMRDEYFPIYYGEDVEGPPPFGFDVAAVPGNREALSRSAASGEIAAGGRIRLFAGKSAGKMGFGMFLPVYRRGAQLETPEQRKASLIGIAESIFIVSSQINELLERIGSPGVRVVLYDNAAPAGERFLAIWPEVEQKDPATSENAGPPPVLERSVNIDVGGRNWVAVFTPEAGNFSTAATWRPWAALAIGVLFSVLLAFYLESLLRYARSVKQQAVSDSLTGLYNRRYLTEFLQRELIRARRSGAPVAAVMIDIDYFKRINDRFGHEAGDMVLAEFGALLKKSIRGSDVACRYGGEEFMVVLPQASAENALRRAEQIRDAVKRLELAYRGEPLGRITASLGVAAFPETASDPDTLLRAADIALYKAKESGRDCAVLSKPALAPQRLNPLPA